MRSNEKRCELWTWLELFLLKGVYITYIRYDKPEVIKIILCILVGVVDCADWAHPTKLWRPISPANTLMQLRPLVVVPGNVMYNRNLSPIYLDKKSVIPVIQKVDVSKEIPCILPLYTLGEGAMSSEMWSSTQRLCYSWVFIKWPGWLLGVNAPAPGKPLLSCR